MDTHTAQLRRHHGHRCCPTEGACFVLPGALTVQSSIFCMQLLPFAPMRMAMPLVLPLPCPGCALVPAAQCNQFDIEVC